MYDWKAKPGWHIVHAQNDLILCILCIFEGILSLDVARITLQYTTYIDSASRQRKSRSDCVDTDGIERGNAVQNIEFHKARRRA